MEELRGQREPGGTNFRQLSGGPYVIYIGPGVEKSIFRIPEKCTFWERGGGGRLTTRQKCTFWERGGSANNSVLIFRDLGEFSYGGKIFIGPGLEKFIFRRFEKFIFS